MIPRLVKDVVEERLATYPAVALIGPRQTGKTTLAQTLSSLYFDLEQPAARTALDVEWEQVFARKQLVVLDEAQAWPELFPRLRGEIDRNRKRAGRILLLGSVSPALMTAVSESLAGRLALVELTPFLLAELPDAPLRNHWLVGGYPEGGILGPKRFPRWETDYLQLLAHRDLPTWGLPARPQVTDRLMKMLAAVHAQQWNASQLGQSLGLSHNTVNSYLDFLEGAFLIRRMRPFHGNVRKRLVKSPKVYWRDTGLLHALLGPTTYRELLESPWVGASWEGYVIEQILAMTTALDWAMEPSFLRTSDGWEIDLVLERGHLTWAIEVKLTTSPAPSDLEQLDRAAALIGAKKRILVSQTPSVAEGKDRISCNLPWLLERMRGGELYL